MPAIVAPVIIMSYLPFPLDVYDKCCWSSADYIPLAGYSNIYLYYYANDNDTKIRRNKL